MKIDLINPSERGILQHAGDRVPLGLLNVGTALQKSNHDVRVYDFNHDNLADYLDNFSERNPDAVGVSVYTSPVYNNAVDIAKLVRRLNADTKLIAGGYHATAMPETLEPYFDTVVKGEADTSINYALTTNGVIESNVPNLNWISEPDRDLINMDNYNMQQNGKRTGTLITSRGCPYECSFCGKMDNKVRFKPVNRVLREVNNLQEAGYEGLYFLDDCFTLDRNRMKEIVRNLSLPYRVTTRANLLDRDKVGLLADTGCETISMGFESGNDEILENINKHMTTDDYRKAVELCGDYNIPVKGFFIIGLPGENEKTARQTINLSQEMKGLGLTDADFYYLTPFPGTPIWDNPDKFGIEITNRDFTKYNQVGDCFVNTEWLDSSRIKELVKEAKSEWKN